MLTDSNSLFFLCLEYVTANCYKLSVIAGEVLSHIHLSIRYVYI